MKYTSLKPKDIVFVSLKGIFDRKKGKPSSEWRFHQDIYVNKKEAKAIVHAHSTCATAISTHQKDIPAFHYMVAAAGGEDIKCSKYATFGTKNLSRNIIPETAIFVDNVMGKNPEKRLQFIKEKSQANEINFVD